MAKFSDDDEKRLKVIGLGQRSIRKNYYSELRQKVNELKELNKKLEWLVEERTHHLVEVQNQLLEAEKMALMGSLVAGVAHEINTPLGNSIMALSFLGDHTKTVRSQLADGTLSKTLLSSFLESTSEAAAISLANLEKAADLVLRFKQVSVDQTAPECRKINLLSYLQDIAMTLKPKLLGHVLQLDVAPDLTIDTNPGALYQIITNLVVNSLVHGFDSAPGGSIHIQAECQGRDLVVLYRDDGQGIAPENRDLIFQPFFTTKRGQGGTGLGLSIVHNLVVQKLRGTIAFRPAPDHGAIFEMRWPVDCEVNPV